MLLDLQSCSTLHLEEASGDGHVLRQELRRACRQLPHGLVCERPQAPPHDIGR
jgi:hypothetical protein